MRASGWIQEVKDRGVRQVASALGLEAVGHNGLGPCPACGAQTRGDRRGALGVRPDDAGWACFRCNAKGDAITLASWCVCGEPRPNKARLRDVRQRCAARGLCNLAGGGTSPFPSVRPPRAEPVPVRPPSREVARVWEQAREVLDDAQARAWLAEQRGLDPGAVADFDLARVIAESASLPPWAFYGNRPWVRSGHRLVVPLFGATGRMESLHARALGASPPKAKAASPSRAGVRGLVMADRLGQLLLADAPLADGSHASAWVQRCGLWVVEGLPDFLTAASQWSDADEDAPAVLGIVSGSWTPELAARLPNGCRVVLALHPDTAGEQYVRRIHETLDERQRRGEVRLSRWRPEHAEVA